VVDVSGHGAASALLAVAIGRLLMPQASASSLLVRSGRLGTQITSPAEVAAELNRRFPMESQNGLYFTMTYGVLDLKTRTLDTSWPDIPGGAAAVGRRSVPARRWFPDRDNGGRSYEQ
jgi:serine phosphatase RsbU (regulator of sigma subunit)